MRPALKGFLILVSLVILGVIIYSDTFQSTFHFDDEIYISENYSLRNIGNLRGIWDFFPTRVIAFLTFALNYAFHKFNLFGYHLVNLLIHLGASILAWQLARLIFATPVMKKSGLARHSEGIAAFTGLIFLAHPIQTQAVTYIWQRCCSLAALFYLASLCLYFKSRLWETSKDDALKGRYFYLSSLGFYILAFFTKENALTLPLIILLCEFSFFRQERGFPWKRVIPFFLLWPVIPVVLLSTSSPSTGDVHRLLGAPDSAITYFLTQLRVLVTYIRLLFLPFNQNLDYDYSLSRTLLDLPTLGSLLILSAVVYLGFRLRAKNRLFSFCIFWFFLTLSVESSFIAFPDVIFEHRLYLPMMGFGLLVSGGAFTFLKKPAYALLLLIVCYSVLSYQRNKVWRDETTLWNDIMRKAPNKVRSYNNRGIDQMNRGDLTQAIEDYNKAIEIHPDSALAYNNRGDAYLNQGDFEQAISDYTRAMGFDPRFTEAYYNRGTAYLKMGELASALADFDKAIKVDPNYSRAYYNRGTVYLRQEDLEGAMADFSRAIQIDPDYAQAYNNRGNLYLRQNDFERAMSDFNRALKANPNIPEIYNNRGNIYMARGQLDEAIKDFNKALVLKPDYASVYCNRGMAFEEAGDHAGAISDYDRAIELNPGFAQAYYIRAIAYFKQGEYDFSWKDVQKARELGYNSDPHFMEQLKGALGRKK